MTEKTTGLSLSNLTLAEKVSLYIVKAGALEKTSPLSDYNEANALGLHLAMTLPPALYRKMIQVIVTPTSESNFLSFTIEARKFFLGDDAGDLGPNEIAISSPGIGQLRN